VKSKLERILRITRNFPDGARRLVEATVMAQRIIDMLAEHEYAVKDSYQFEEAVGCAKELGYMLRDLVWVELWPEDNFPDKQIKGKAIP
jgi:hypothetical protein